MSELSLFDKLHSTIKSWLYNFMRVFVAGKHNMLCGSETLFSSFSETFFKCHLRDFKMG